MFPTRKIWLHWPLWALLFALLAPKLHAQDAKMMPELGIDFNFNHTDVMMGGLGGIAFPTLNASLLATFKGRIGTKRVIVEAEEADVFYQYRERRYLLGLQAEKRFLLNEFDESSHLGAYLAGIGGLGFGDYRGTKAPASTGFAYSAEAGAYFSDPEAVILRLGYQYLPMHTANVFDHRIVLTITFLPH
jgi:hypothetical protein